MSEVPECTLAGECQAISLRVSQVQLTYRHSGIVVGS